MEKVSTVEQFDELLKKENSFFLLKHSLTCPISHAAYEEYQKYSGAHQEIPSYFLAVQDSRSLSNEIAERFQIKHESPQAIFFLNGKPVWNASHWKITNRSLADAISEHS